jgi:hypothetical protein
MIAELWLYALGALAVLVPCGAEPRCLRTFPPYSYQFERLGPPAAVGEALLNTIASRGLVFTPVFIFALYGGQLAAASGWSQVSNRIAGILAAH